MRLRSLLLIAGLAGGIQAHAQTEVVNGIAVIVNSAVVTYKEVQDMMRPGMELLERQLARQPQALQQKATDLQKDIIEQLVERELILFDFTSAGYSLPEAIIEETIQERIRQRYGDRLTLTKTLQAEGITYESFRREIREQIIVEALAQKNISSSILISPQKIEDYFKANQGNYQVEDQVKLRMIVLNQTAGMPEGAAKKLAGEILSKLKEGASFADMASIYSEGSQRAQGGDWGWVEKKVLRKELADKAFHIKVGEVSDIVETSGSCYLMLVEEKRDAGTRKLTEVRDDIEKSLVNEERARLRKKYIDRLRKKSFIRYF